MSSTTAQGTTTEAARDARADTVPAADEPGLELQGLRKRLGGRDVVASIDLDVRRGELVSLLGPSGCGKTTTLRMIAGFLGADDGRVLMGGRDVTRMGPERRPSAMVFQNYALWPHMTVTQNVAFPLRTRKVPKPETAERVTAALELVGLTHHAASKPTAISGGEQQRVALARAVVQEPDVLLLDEPLSNLDAKLRVGVREELRRIQRRLGITTLIVTHDQDEALSISDRIAVMHDGRIEQVATPAELYSAPRTRFVADFIGTTSVVEGRMLTAVDDAVLRRSGLASGIGDRDVVLVRPEEVHLDGTGATVPARVDRVVMRGHFTEVVVVVDGAELHSFVSGPGPRVGDELGVGFGRVLVYRDGTLLSGGTALSGGTTPSGGTGASADTVREPGA